MRARAPLDVDLEDKLLYGLTPMRLAYLVIGLVAGFGLWSSQWAPSPVRAFVCVFAIAAGAIAAWGRWRGRAVDGWAADFALFVLSTHRIVFDEGWFQRFRRRRRILAPQLLPARGSVVIVVMGRAPKAGATTVATEIAACLAIKGCLPDLWSVRDAPADHVDQPSPSAPLLSVASVDGGRVCYLDRGAGPSVAGVIPEDDLVREAAESGQAAVVAFPEAAVSKAFVDLVAVITAAA
jgi:hypothetical protein